MIYMKMSYRNKNTIYHTGRLANRKDGSVRPVDVDMIYLIKHVNQLINNAVFHIECLSTNFAQRPITLNRVVKQDKDLIRDKKLFLLFYQY